MKVTKTQITDAKEHQIPGSRLLEAGTTPLLRKNTAITNIRFELRQFGDKITLFSTHEFDVGVKEKKKT